MKTANSGERRCAVRLSEYESINTCLTLAGLVDWIWIDYFSTLPINNNDYKLILEHLSKINFIDLKKYFSKKNIYKIISFMRSDKKNYSDTINIITLQKIGGVSINKQFSSSMVKKFILTKLLK